MKLINGCCLEGMSKLRDGSIDLVLTDPPYKMTKQGKSCRPNYMRSGMGENLFEGKLVNTESWMSLCFNKMATNSHFYTFTNINSLPDYLEVAKKCGFKLHNIISMIKDTKMPNRWYLKYTELVLFFRKGKAFPINDMSSRDYEFVTMPTKKNGKLHVSQKPLSFIEKLVRNSTVEGGVVLDPFMGSGTTGVACANLNRDFVGIELDEKYFQIAKDRIDQQKPNNTFNETKI